MTYAFLCVEITQSSVFVSVGTGISIYQFRNQEVESSGVTGLVAGLVSVFAFLIMALSAVIVECVICFVGVILSFVNVRISQSPAIKKSSAVFLYSFLGVLVLLIGLLIYVSITVM